DLIVGQAPPSDPIQVVGRLEGDLSTAITSIGRTSDQIGQLAGQVNDLLRGNGEQFSRIVTKVERTLDGLQTAVGSVNEMLADPDAPLPPQAEGPLPEATAMNQPTPAGAAGQPQTVVIEPPDEALTPRSRGQLRRAMEELPQIMS